MRRNIATPHKCETGFTIFEMVVVCILLAVLVLLSTRMFSNVIRGYVLSRNSDAAVQKAQNAMQRMTLDFTYLMIDGATGTGNSLTYNMALANTSQVTIKQSDDRIMYGVNGGSYILTDGVKAGSLAFSYYNSYDGAALNVIKPETRLVGLNFIMVGSDVNQGFSQSYTTRVMVGKVR